MIKYFFPLAIVALFGGLFASIIAPAPSVPVASGRMLSSARPDEINCGFAPPDEPTTVITSTTSLNSAVSTYNLDLPTWLPSGYAPASIVDVEEDSWDDSVVVTVAFINSAHASSYGSAWNISILYASGNYLGGLPNTTSNELAWETSSGDLRWIQITNPNAVNTSALELIACSMASYTGSC